MPQGGKRRLLLSGNGSESLSRTGSGDCVVISLHLRLFGSTSGRRKGEKERERQAGEGGGGGIISRERKETQMVPREGAQYHRRAGECGSEVPDTSHSG